MSNPASPVSRTSTAPSSGRASPAPAPAPMPASCPVANGNGPALRRAMLRHSSISSVEFYDVAFKVMLVGDSGVGKTCLLIRYKDGSFLSGAYISTVGMDFRNKVVTVDDYKVKLQIWDTAGQERFRSVTHAYYRDAHALLLLYDVSNKTSFDNTRAWLGEINEYAQDDVVIMLIGNKADITQDRQVRTEDGERLSREYGVAFMETSAKTGCNVELAFMAVARSRALQANERNEPQNCERPFGFDNSDSAAKGCKWILVPLVLAQCLLETSGWKTPCHLDKQLEAAYSGGTTVDTKDDDNFAAEDWETEITTPFYIVPKKPYLFGKKVFVPSDLHAATTRRRCPQFKVVEGQFDDADM
ncbi:ras-related protein Rab-26-like isoform X2 [Dermacentor andersoni]|uniref:ras-related protein Rab-26-like isoform X2 n=1 Tax=Dermacentor andersoni TaxID=34620 RepID=UPI003B3AE96E